MIDDPDPDGPFPESIGDSGNAKVAYPDKKVIAVTGDGCFLMASADFATGVEAGLNPVIVILNDRQPRETPGQAVGDRFDHRLAGVGRGRLYDGSGFLGEWWFAYGGNAQANWG